MKSYDRRQLKAMCFVASLAPVTRLLPKATAQLAGSASWLAPLCALPPLLLFLLVLTALMKMRREGEGLGEVLMLSLIHISEPPRPLYLSYAGVCL